MLKLLRSYAKCEYGRKMEPYVEEWQAMGIGKNISVTCGVCEKEGSTSASSQDGK